ncbi:MAG: glycine zipper 2TM domain-containing protein [Gammaproteobacteria bacterium]|nr:glycine zipper 2TM domain-containing protein [Gammaproteobacteria bacterium]
MNKKLTSLIFALILGSTVGCTNLNNQEQGTITGGAIGAAVGGGIAAATGGNGWTGAAIGAVAGGVAGNMKGKRQDY